LTVFQWSETKGRRAVRKAARLFLRAARRRSGGARLKIGREHDLCSVERDQRGSE
jgi:hypothetical protein